MNHTKHKTTVESFYGANDQTNLFLKKKQKTVTKQYKTFYVVGSPYNRNI